MKKVQIISNNMCYGPAPRSNTEIEQHLTINEKGQIWFSRYRYGNGETRYPLISKECLHIAKEDAEEILRLADEVTKIEDDLFVTDVGYWELTITDADNRIAKKMGSLIRQDSEIIQKLCDRIRSALNCTGLFLLDGE
jgi:hypothetical protein